MKENDGKKHTLRNFLIAIASALGIASIGAIALPPKEPTPISNENNTNENNLRENTKLSKEDMENIDAFNTRVYIEQIFRDANLGDLNNAGIIEMNHISEGFLFKDSNGNFVYSSNGYSIDDSVVVEHPTQYTAYALVNKENNTIVACALSDSKNYYNMKIIDNIRTDTEIYNYTDNINFVLEHESSAKSAYINFSKFLKYKQLGKYDDYLNKLANNDIEKSKDDNEISF